LGWINLYAKEGLPYKAMVITHYPYPFIPSPV
jgi:hypothetical protein